MTKPSKSEASARNADPITGAPGAHPVGVGVGGIAGGAAGAITGALFGPIGLLVGTAVGTVAGAGAGKGVAESLDPTADQAYWRDAAKQRSYYDTSRDFDTHYAPAYAYGTRARSEFSDRLWDASLESDLARDWSKARDSSELDWNAAQPAVKDAWDRADRTYRAYDASDALYRERYEQATYSDRAYPYEDYRQAYRYGTYARMNQPDRAWNEDYERELAQGWEAARGNSRLDWTQARHAAKDAWTIAYPNLGERRDR